jgi:hypothetical protein
MSETPIIDKADASTGRVLDNEEVGELPINGRDYARFSLLTPGAIFRSNFIADLAFEGLHSVHNQFSIDGIDASCVADPFMANGFERGARLLTGSLDTVEQFNVQTSGYSAEYGRAAGSYINIATKSGTNDFHGTAYDYFRNNILDARNFFATIGPVAIHEEHVFASGLVNDFLAGMQRWVSRIDTVEPLPLTTIVGYSVIPGTQGNSLENNTSYQYGHTMSKVKGRHALTWGGGIYRIWVNTNSTAKPTMQFNSPQEFVNDQLSTVTIVNATPGNGVRATQVGLFVDDKFQVVPTLSLDVGLRYDIETVPHDSRHATRPYDKRTGTLGPPAIPTLRLTTKTSARASVSPGLRHRDS